jgi:FKBP-type peptidyl-prolyl cis-trans isomerase FklB
MILAAGDVLAQDLSTDKGKLSYALGWDVGNGLKRYNTDFDIEALVAAIRDASADREARVDAEEMVTLLSDLQQKVNEEQLARLKQMAEENLAESEQFLEQNKTKLGIVVMESGVQYRIIDEGEGPRPNFDSTIRLHYRGSKIDGREFDSSFVGGVPQEVKIDELGIAGWQEVLPLMKQGATWQIFLPPELAFGERGSRVVEPNEVLVFDLKLIEIIE